MTGISRETARSKKSLQSLREVGALQFHFRLGIEHFFSAIYGSYNRIAPICGHPGLINVGQQTFVRRACECAIDAIRWTPRQINDQMELAGGMWRRGCN